MAKAAKGSVPSSEIREDLDGATLALDDFDAAVAAGQIVKKLTDPLDDCADHADKVPQACKALAKDYRAKPVDRRVVVRGRQYTIWARTEEEYAARVAALKEVPE